MWRSIPGAQALCAPCGAYFDLVLRPPFRSGPPDPTFSSDSSPDFASRAAQLIPGLLPRSSRSAVICSRRARLCCARPAASALRSLVSSRKPDCPHRMNAASTSEARCGMTAISAAAWLPSDCDCCLSKAELRLSVPAICTVCSSLFVMMKAGTTVAATPVQDQATGNCRYAAAATERIPLLCVRSRASVKRPLQLLWLKRLKP